MKQRLLWVAGVDEAGRGPLAGPVAVGMVVTPADFDWESIPGVNDSKKLSERTRENIAKSARALARAGALRYHVALVSCRTIDTHGITYSVTKGIERCIKKLSLHPKDTLVKLDGLLHMPPHFTHQETIVGGDAKECVIGLASILAKVTRDAYMVRAGKRYPEYGFEIHKGYGTKAHREALRAHGLCPLHRTSFVHFSR